MDEALRQRIKYLIEHGGCMPPERPASRRLLFSVGLFVAVLQLIEIGLQLTG